MMKIIQNLQRQISDANELLGKSGLSSSKSMRETFMNRLDSLINEQKQKFDSEISLIRSHLD